MRTFDFYEFAVLLTPGAVLLIDVMGLVPDVTPMVNVKDAAFGNLGLFVARAYGAYATDHVVQAPRGMLEYRLW